MFSDHTDLFFDNPPLMGYGAAVTPGQRGPIVFVAGHGDANRLLSWEGGRLVDRSCGVLADTTRQAIGVAAADLDADGAEEIYVHNTEAYDGVTDNTDLLLDQVDHDGRTVWCDVFGDEVNAGRGNVYAGRSVAALDRLGTGRYGMIVTSYGETTRYYELGDDREITDMADAVGLDCSCGGRSLVTAPICTDSMDVFVGVDGGPNRLFRNEEGHFVDVASEVGVAAPNSDARGATLVDTGDGESALAVVSWADQNHLFAPTVDGFTDIAPATFAEPARARTLLAADFDNDGHQELFVNVRGGPNRLFAPTSGGWEAVSPGEAVESNGFGTGGIVADLDNDGTLELLVVHGEVEAQPLSLYSASTDNHWLRVVPTTQYSAPARGAVVTLQTDQGRQRQVIDAGSSYLCQSEPVAHFGLGGDTARRQEPIQLTVRWPDGRERNVDHPSIDTTLRVSHPNCPDN